MSKKRLYKNVRSWLLAVFIATLALTVKTALAKVDVIPPEFIYYDYIDDKGELNGGMIKVNADSPLHSKYKFTERVILESTQYNVETIINNGPTENRLDLVFLGDGYQEDDLDDYASHVDIIVEGFFAEAPFDEYASFFNVHRVDVISTDEGVSNDPCDDPPEEKVTALKMRFDNPPMERLLYIPIGVGETAAYAAASQAPDSDEIIALGYTETYGGSGRHYRITNPDKEGLACVAGGNQWRVAFAHHEFGHSFAYLGDEYWTDDEDYTGDEPEQANLSTHNYDSMKTNSEKWYLWLDVETVPDYHGPIDTYEGGYELYETGIYRPTDWSIMRRFVDEYYNPCPFHQVNAEHFVLKIYGSGDSYDFVDPIDYGTPNAGKKYAIGKIFFVEPVKPATHSLDVTWYLVGNPDPVGTGKEFDSSTLDLPTGQYTLKVKVVDNTPMIKDEDARDDYMTEWREWTLGEAAYWKFDEGGGGIAEDSIGDNNGILGTSPYDPAWVEDEDPVRGSCLEFDGGDYVYFSTMDALEDSDATMSAWINAKNLGTVGTDYYSILSQLNGSNGYELYINGDKPAFRLNDTYSVQSSEAIDEGKWYYLAGTYDGSNLKIYVNGELTSWPVSGLSGVSNTGYIGWLFDGRIDDVRVYDWALDMFGIWNAMSGDASRFRIKDSSGETVAWFDSLGNLFLKGTLTQGGGQTRPIATGDDEFIFKDSSGNLMIINMTNGNMDIYGSYTEDAWQEPSEIEDEFVIEGPGATGVVAYINASGDLYLKGKLYENPY